MYAQSFLTTSDLGIGPFPTTASKSAESLSGFMKAEFAFPGILIVRLSYLTIAMSKINYFNYSYIILPYAIGKNNGFAIIFDFRRIFDTIY